MSASNLSPFLGCHAVMCNTLQVIICISDSNSLSVSMGFVFGQPQFAVVVVVGTAAVSTNVVSDVMSCAEWPVLFLLSLLLLLVVW